MNAEIIKLKQSIRCEECEKYINHDINCVRLWSKKIKVSKGTFHFECYKDFCERGLSLINDNNASVN